MGGRVDLLAARFSIASGKTIAETARDLGVTPQSVRRALRSAGVPPRAPARSKDLAQDRLERTWKRIRRDAAWTDVHAFTEWAKASGYRLGQVLERKSAARPYSPRNARWVTRSAAAKKAQIGVEKRLAHGAPIDWKRVRTFYVTQGLDITETAKRAGASYHGVLKGLRRRGWLRAKQPSVAQMTHGSTLYRVWQGISRRCESPKDRDYVNIGAKGIRVRWTEFPPFHVWALKAGYKPGLVLVRFDRARDYEPKNCAWMPASKASAYKPALRITPTPRRLLTAFGETKGLVAWTRDKRCAVGLDGLTDRLDRGMRPELAITTASAHHGPRPGKRLVTAFGVTKSVAAWARDRRAKVGHSTIRRRLSAGWAAEKAIAMRALAG